MPGFRPGPAEAGDPRSLQLVVHQATSEDAPAFHLCHVSFAAIDAGLAAPPNNTFQAHGL